jgi:hypothetical protein
VTLTVVLDKSRRTIKVTPERKTAPATNLTDLQAVPMARLRVSPRVRVDSIHRALQAMPRIESFVLPKIDKLVAPRVMRLPRVEPLPVMTDSYFE